MATGFNQILDLDYGETLASVFSPRPRSGISQRMPALEKGIDHSTSRDKCPGGTRIGTAYREPKHICFYGVIEAHQGCIFVRTHNDMHDAYLVMRSTNACESLCRFLDVKLRQFHPKQTSFESSKSTQDTRSTRDESPISTAQQCFPLEERAMHSEALLENINGHRNQRSKAMSVPPLSQVKDTGWRATALVVSRSISSIAPT